MSVSDVEQLVSEVLGDRKNANKIKDLIEIVENNEREEFLCVALTGLCEFFIKTKNEKDISKDGQLSAEMRLYFDWTKERLQETLNACVRLFENENVKIREYAIVASLIFIKSEQVLIENSENTSIQFSDVSTYKFVAGLLTHDLASTDSELTQKPLLLADVRHFVLRLIPKFLKQGSKASRNITERVFSLLKLTSETMDNNDSEMLCSGGLSFIFPDNDCVNAISSQDLTEGMNDPKPFDFKEHKRVFGNAWLELLRQDLSTHLFKNVLVILQKHIIPNFASPCLLADFLTRSFSQGGGIALLSLHGIFILMTEHNLEYPQFYTHLYSMIHPRIFDAKYQSRFFYLLNLFLASTHLPAYLVAAFAKKLARLCLVAPTYAQQLLVSFILTLVDRHPSIRILINRKNSKDSSLKSDPYLASQEDPAQCKAMESSLWELATLKNHFLPQVANYVKEIDKGPKDDVLSKLEESYEDCFNSAREKITDVPMNFQTPHKLFGGFEDSVLDLWSI